MKFLQSINNFFRQIRYTTYIFYLNSKIKKKVNFSFSDKNTLKLMFNKYGSDKGNLNNKHNYSIIYESLFEQIRNNDLNLMEVGLGSIDEKVDFHMKFMGKNYKPLASLYAWRDYFKNATIYGADIDKKILKDTSRIKTFHVDMLDAASIKKMWKKVNKKVDIIIDDGFHSYKANTNLFNYSFKFLKKNGFYIIEDVHRKPLNIKKFFKFFEEKKVNFQIVNLYHKNNINDNCLIIIKK
ncbi:hypothetical protein OA339_00125 [Candidatus Pelagibacter sp.]|nr:hypothetical protein [Candidatus Pelagibacter sp.]